MLGIVAFLDLNWNERWTSTVGYSYMDIDNTDAMDADSFKKGQYALANILYHPAPGFFLGPRGPVGQAGELPRRLQLGRPAGPVLGQVQLQLLVGRQVMNGSKTVGRGLRLLAVATVVLAVAAPFAHAQTPAEIQAALDAAHAKYQTLKEGKNADYIPALAKVDSNIYGIALVTTDGKVYTAGDVKSEVSIQSISKVFTMAKVIEDSGPDAIANTIGTDATGMRFNSIVSIEFSQKALGGPEMNALVNPGAIAATSMLKGASRDAIWQSLLGYYSDFAGRPLSVNQEVFKSESDTNQRNQAIGYLMYAYGYIKAEPHAGDRHLHRAVLGERQREGPRHDGGDARERREEPRHRQAGPQGGVRAQGPGGDGHRGPLRRLGQVAVGAPGFPAKSGVGGGIVAVSPGKFGIAVISPPLDEAGNSVRAQKAIADISNALGGTPTP